MSVTTSTDETTPPRRSALRWIGIAILVTLFLPVVAYGGFVLYVMYGVEISDDVGNADAKKSPAVEKTLPEKSSATKSVVASKTDAKTSDSKANAAKTPKLSADDQHRLDIVGKWKREDDGRREFTINADGTAELVYKPTGTNRFFLATSKLTVQVEWTLKDGYVDFVSKSGEPAYAFKVAKISEGATKRRRIVELTKDKLTLTNDAEDRVSYWSRADK